MRSARSSWMSSSTTRMRLMGSVRRGAGRALRRRLCRGQADDHGEAAAGGVLGGEGAAHGFGEAAGDAQPEPESVVGAVAEALEGSEQAFALAGRHAGALIDDAELDLVGVAAGAQRDRGAGGMA